ncbi:MAG TPA: MBL fold metallo-hydrolase [Syntrophomonadaceae bacterium]|nr:MBL fold metallo-hydrolase [Syntrophomonadaceae bacterium]HQA06942.1 MBL fold metallo-hydrolase [Syntrophomonadaceae bacterium]HQE23165.1 MBL fold metallo-hydrolase [Syntrophomonadaceae bacterium]
MKAIIVILALVTAVVIILWCLPAFGANPYLRKSGAFNFSPNYRRGKFVNVKPARMQGGGNIAWAILTGRVKKHPQSRPPHPLKVDRLDRTYLQTDQRSQAIWLGHSTLLLRMAGQLLLLDPMLGQIPSPLPPLGGRRYSRGVPVNTADLPFIDAVLVSHDHYDHLDYGTIRKFRNRVGQFFVPLGVGSHLERWGIPPAKINECDWWEEVEYGSLRFTCTPARHFSGRTLNSRNSTLWCSWVIIGPDARVFFSGDGGYGSHFKQIGDKYGPFDLTLMECGQYDKLWSAIHMTPEQTVEAHIDVRGKVLLPIHWAAFTLALHSWTDPIERVTQAAAVKNQQVTTPHIGQPVIIGDPDYPCSVWWREYMQKEEKG